MQLRIGATTAQPMICSSTWTQLLDAQICTGLKRYYTTKVSIYSRSQGDINSRNGVTSKKSVQGRWLKVWICCWIDSYMSFTIGWPWFDSGRVKKVDCTWEMRQKRHLGLSNHRSSTDFLDDKVATVWKILKDCVSSRTRWKILTYPGLINLNQTIRPDGIEAWDPVLQLTRSHVSEIYLCAT